MRIVQLAVMAGLFAGACSPAVQAQQTFTYRGMCDASAAVALGPDHFIVADDEVNTLQIYRRNREVAVGAVDLSAFLGTEPDKESDLEGAAAIGARIYWISSHGRNKDGEEKKRRYQFFATDIHTGSTPTVVPVGASYTGLLKDLLGAPGLAPYKLAAAAKLAPKAAGGLNIEGMAATPEGQLLIGFRSPLAGNKALLLPLTNPSQLLLGKRANFGAPIELDLGGRGIRSIELVGASYLIIAGPAGENGDFALYRWSGKVADQPLALHNAALNGLHPEALFAMPAARTIQILSDDGSARINGATCKDLHQSAQSFRSFIVLP